MKRAQRLLAATVGAAAIALGAAALAGPATAAPSSSPSSSPSPSTSSSPSGSPSPSPSKPSTAPSTSSSTSDSPSTGTEKAAPKATVYDLELAAESTVILRSNGPGTATNSVSVSVHNAGTVTQQGLTITVVEPSDAQLTGAVTGAHGIDHCVHGVQRGLGELTCQVHDSGPGADNYEYAHFVLSGQVPLPNEPNTPYGTVTLHGYHAPNANPAGTEVAFEVTATDTSKPSQTMDLVTTASPVTMARGSDGLYHGVLRISVTNRGHDELPPLTLNIDPPDNATVVGPVDALFPWPCGRMNSPSYGDRSLRCQGGGTFRPGQTFGASFRLTADRPTTNGTVGHVSADVVSDHTWTEPSNANIVQYPLTFATTPASASASGSGQAAGSGTSLPVTGTPLALIAGGGATVLVAGGALLVLSRRRRVQ
jgi:hypothetical protein